MSPLEALYPVVHLVDDWLERGPWVYGRKVAWPENPPAAGALVEVRDASDRFVGHALWNGQSDVRLRYLSRGRRGDLDRPKDFLKRKLKAADDLRKKTLRLPSVTDAYRIVHGEGDDLSGLVVDRLATSLVVEHHALGFWELRQQVKEALLELYPGSSLIQRIPNSAQRAEGFSESALREAEGEQVPDVIVHEHGVEFVVSPGQGHKTGFFCDQRDNRQRVAQLAVGRSLLDLCCNSGGFALHAARAGAREVFGIDLDEVVLERARQSAARNHLNVQFAHADAFDALRGLAAANTRYDLVVLDPSKLAAGRATLEVALRKYLDLNALALGAVRPGGLLVTFSCSGAVDLQNFMGTLFHASRRAERDVRLLEVLGAAADHPQRPDFPRSRYLKGAVLSVD